MSAPCGPERAKFSLIYIYVTSDGLTSETNEGLTPYNTTVTQLDVHHGVLAVEPCFIALVLLILAPKHNQRSSQKNLFTRHGVTVWM